MVKPENKFRTWFIHEARLYLKRKYPGLKSHFQKHADMVTVGIPDMSIAIGGVTIWVEFKYLNSCVKGRKTNVSPTQTACLEELAEASVPRGLLIGLPLGPRKGYLVAFYHEELPTIADRDDFGSLEASVDTMVEMALRTGKSMGVFLYHRVHTLPVHLPSGHDDVQEDGG